VEAAGIVAEYNPFHGGHAFHIAESRRRLGVCAPRDGGASACRAAAERAAEELLLRGAAGVPVDGLSMGETEYLEAEGLYRLAVRCRCGAWIAAWAVEDGGRLTDFEVRGTMR